jgi:hypothetical protein
MKRLADVDARRDRLVEAFVYERAVDRATYDAMLSKLTGERLEIEQACSEAEVERFDATAVVDYAIHVFMHAGALWRDAEAQQRGPLQAFLFPAGLKWGRNGFVRTALTGLMFCGLDAGIGIDCKYGAGNGIRTRDFNLGKVALYH